MSASFHNADKPTHRRVMLVGLIFCSVFVTISYFAKPQTPTDQVFLKADRLARTAGQPIKAN